MRSKTDIPRYSLESVDYDSISVFYNSTWIQHHIKTSHTTTHHTNTTSHITQYNITICN